VLARGHHRQRPLGRVDVEGEVHDAVVDVAADLVARLGEDREHPPVLGQHLGDEAGDALLARGGGQVLQEHRAHAAALVGVGDVERHLGEVVLDPVVAADPDDRVAGQDDEGHPVGVVDLGEPAQVAVGQARHGREEAQVRRARRLGHVEGLELLGVLGRDRPQVRRAAVAQDHVGLPRPGPNRVRRSHAARLALDYPPLPGC
jgi:hypothetical protein